MKRISFHVFAMLVSTSLLNAELRHGDVRGLEHSPKSDQAGFSVILLDLHADDQLIAGVASVPDAFGGIESATLIVIDESGKHLCRVFLVPQKLERGTTDFQFYLRRDLLKSSYLAVSHRTGDDLYVAKFVLGSFYVRDSKK